jgi:hypothetical protein
VEWLKVKALNSSPGIAQKKKKKKKPKFYSQETKNQISKVILSPHTLHFPFLTSNPLAINFL